MKKLLTLILAGVISATLISCSEADKKENNDNKNDKNEVVETVKVADAYELIDSLYADVSEDNKPMLMTEILNADNFEWLSFIPYEEGLEGVVNQPMMGSIAHKVVIIKAKDNADAQRVAELLKANADPRWLVCVEADDVRTATNENLAMLLLTNTELGMGDKIADAFAKLDKESIANLPKFEAPVFEDEGIDDEMPEEDVLAGVDDEVAEQEDFEQIHFPNEEVENVEEETEIVEEIESFKYEDTIYGVIDSFYAAIPEDNKPFLMTQVVDEETFEWLTFIPYEEGLEAVVSQPMMGSIAHKVVIVRCKDNADAKRVEGLLKTNADPRWLVCVEADDVRTATNGNLAFLMLTNKELGMGDTIAKAFNGLSASTIAEIPSFFTEPVVE